MPVLDEKRKRCTFCRGSSCEMFAISDCFFSDNMSNYKTSIYILKLPTFPLCTFQANPFEHSEVCQAYSDLTWEKLDCARLFETPNNLVADFAFLASMVLLRDKFPPQNDPNLCTSPCFYDYNIVFPSKRHLRATTNSKAKCDPYIGLFSLDDDFIVQLDLKTFNRISSIDPNFKLRFVPCPEIMKHESISLRVRKSTQNKLAFLIFPREYINFIKIKSSCIYMTMQLIFRPNQQMCNVISSTLLIKQDYKIPNKCHKLLPTFSN